MLSNDIDLFNSIVEAKNEQIGSNSYKYPFYTFKLTFLTYHHLLNYITIHVTTDFSDGTVVDGSENVVFNNRSIPLHPRIIWEIPGIEDMYIPRQRVSCTGFNGVGT